MERAVLGAIMLDRTALDIAAVILNPEAFYVDAHRMVYMAAQELSRKRQAIDILTVINQLQNAGELDAAGGAYGVTKLTNDVVSGAHTETHCRIIKEKFIQRELIRRCAEITNAAYEDGIDAFDLLDLAEEKILSIGENSAHGEMIPMAMVMKQALAKIDQYRKADSHITGVPTGFPSLDRATRGWQPGLIIIGARPSVGKTAFALQVAASAAENELKKVAVGMWSLEMKAMQQGIRMLSTASETYLTRLQTGRVDDEQMEHLRKTAQRLANLEIFFDDGFGLTILSLSAKARRLKRRQEKSGTPLGLIIIDYLQLVSGMGGKGNREQEISNISRGLKKLSMELDVPVIALSQLSRALEGRTEGKREPQLSDLRESGAIEQDADMVMFLWGPEDKEIQEDASLINRRYGKISKQRDGVLLKVDLEFRAEIQKITEFVPEQAAPNPAGSWRPININLPYKDE